MSMQTSGRGREKNAEAELYNMMWMEAVSQLLIMLPDLGGARRYGRLAVAEKPALQS